VTDVDGSPLGAIGLEPDEERAYRHLVAAGDARSPAQVGHALGLTSPDAADLLGRLSERGLATPLSGDGWRASPPEVALGTLVNQRTGELDRIRLLMAELQGQYREARHRRAAELIDVIHGQDQINRYYLHLVRGAMSGLDILTKPPYLAGDGLVHALHAEDAGIRRGVRSRSVYDGDALGEHGTLAIARQSIGFGEEARATGGLPFKLAIVDGRTGFLPLDIRTPALGALIVHSSALLDALIALFEGIWLRAVPMRADRAAADPDSPATRAADVLRLMSAGMKDEAIARALNVSRRTVQKTVTDIMTTLGARTRFQAALLASERGWVG